MIYGIIIKMVKSTEKLILAIKDMEVKFLKIFLQELMRFFRIDIMKRQMRHIKNKSNKCKIMNFL